jgi:hypothetical protein
MRGQDCKGPDHYLLLANSSDGVERGEHPLHLMYGALSSPDNRSATATPPPTTRRPSMARESMTTLATYSVSTEMAPSRQQEPQQPTAAALAPTSISIAGQPSSSSPSVFTRRPTAERQGERPARRSNTRGRRDAALQTLLRGSVGGERAGLRRRSSTAWPAGTARLQHGQAVAVAAAGRIGNARTQRRQRSFSVSFKISPCPSKKFLIDVRAGFSVWKETFFFDW